MQDTSVVVVNGLLRTGGPALPVLHIEQAYERLKEVVNRTPLQRHEGLSRKYNAHVYLKREDLQVVRSYKLRGAYNMMSSLPKEVIVRGVVCASAGNHAQGFAWSCRQLKVKGTVFMPIITPSQKIQQTRLFGEQYIDIRLVGDTFDDCAAEALKYTQQHALTFIPPFEHPLIMEGQGTVGVEIWQELPEADVVILPIGGGGLAAGTGSYLRQQNPSIRLIGVEPEGAPSMQAAFDAGQPVTLEQIERFVDGASVKRVGDMTYRVCREVLDQLQTVAEGKICSTILELYNRDAIVVEPAGAMSIAVLDQVADEIRGKVVVCVVSGSNNDIDRMQEIKERSLQYEGLKHYFLINFSQRPGALREFVNEILGPDDDITRFEYMKKNNRDKAPALVGVELKSRADYERLIANLHHSKFPFTELNKDDTLFGYLV